MLKRLTIRGFKSIRTLEDFELRDLNVLIGANGAGKSNFIALFQMLARLMNRSLRLFVREQEGPNALLFGGRKRTKTLEAKFIFDRNGYEFSLVPAGGVTCGVRWRVADRRKRSCPTPTTRSQPTSGRRLQVGASITFTTRVRPRPGLSRSLLNFG